MRRLTLWLPPLIYMAVIFSISAQSNPLPRVTATISDHILHAIEYGLLAVLFVRALTGEGMGRWSAIVVAILLTSTYGATDEYHQLFVPNRNSDVYDWIADTIGGAVAACAYALWPRRGRT